MLGIIRTFNKFIFAEQIERLNIYKLFNKLFNKEIIYEYKEYKDYS